MGSSGGHGADAMFRMTDISWSDNIDFKSRTGQPTISDVTSLVRLLVGWLEKLQKSQPVRSFDWLAAGWF